MRKKYLFPTLSLSTHWAPTKQAAKTDSLREEPATITKPCSGPTAWTGHSILNRHPTWTGKWDTSHSSHWQWMLEADDIDREQPMENFTNEEEKETLPAYQIPQLEDYHPIRAAVLPHTSHIKSKLVFLAGPYKCRPQSNRPVTGPALPFLQHGFLSKVPHTILKELDSTFIFLAPSPNPMETHSLSASCWLVNISYCLNETLNGRGYCLCAAIRMSTVFKYWNEGYLTPNSLVKQTGPTC